MQPPITHPLQCEMDKLESMREYNLYVDCVALYDSRANSIESY